MNLREVECFLKVAEHLHFGRAAEELFLGQPAVSESIRRLERELGGALFDRTTRRVRLTPLGDAFQDEARVAYDMLRRAYERGRSMAEQNALEFALGYSGDLGGELLDVVAELKRQVDGVVVSLRAMPTPHQTRRIRDGRLHAAIGWEPERDPDFYRVELGPAQFVAVVSPDHRFAGRESISVAELASEPLIGWPRAVNPSAYDRFARAMDDSGHAWTLVGTATGPENVAARVLSDFGIGVCFASAAQARPLDSVAYIPLPDLRPDIERVLYWRRGVSHPALKSFVKIATRRLARQCGSEDVNAPNDTRDTTFEETLL